MLLYAKHVQLKRPMFVCHALLLSIALCLLLSGCQEAQPSSPNRPVVKTMRISMDIGSKNRSYPGVIVARHEVQESFRVDGRIVKRLIDVGDRVHAGQVLAALDENDLRLSMESALAEFKAATANRAQALTDEGRYASLLSHNAVSHIEFDARHLAAEEAKGRLDRAARALSLAKNRNDYSRLVSSADGVVTKVSAEAGQVVSPGQAIVSVAKAGELEVLVDVPESQIQSLQNTPAEVTLWSSGDGHYRAVLREIAPAADPVTRTYAVRYTLQGANASVRLGMTATLHLSEPAGVQTARIPVSALFNQGKGPGIWIVNPKSGQLAFRPVVVDRYTDRDAFVHGQLANGDTVVTSGVQKLDEGTIVRLVDAPQGDVR